MARKPVPGLHMVTANRLCDGVVVYLREDGTWTEWIAEGCIAGDEEASQVLLETGEGAAEGNVADAPYLIDVRVDGGQVVPLRYRERIRAEGPSIHPDLGKQAAIRD